MSAIALFGGMPIVLKDNGDGTYTLRVDADLQVGEVTIGAVEIKDRLTNDKVKVNQDGSMLVDVKDVLIEYRDSDVDVTGDTHYYGYISRTGKWYILRESISGDIISYRYARGDSNYIANWNNRANLTYNYFNVAFGG